MKLKSKLKIGLSLFPAYAIGIFIYARCESNPICFSNGYCFNPLWDNLCEAVVGSVLIALAIAVTCGVVYLPYRAIRSAMKSVVS
jgi:uncharacterized membrane protein